MFAIWQNSPGVSGYIDTEFFFYLTYALGYLRWNISLYTLENFLDASLRCFLYFKWLALGVSLFSPGYFCISWDCQFISGYQPWKTAEAKVPFKLAERGFTVRWFSKRERRGEDFRDQRHRVGYQPQVNKSIKISPLASFLSVWCHCSKSAHLFV